MGDTPLTLSGAVLGSADIAENVETTLAKNPAYAEALSANPHLKAASWRLVLSHKPRVKVVANLCDRELDAERIGDLADAHEVRYRALAALEKRNGITAEHATRLSARRMPSGSAMLLMRRPGLDQQAVDQLFRNLSPRAGVLFAADDPFARRASATAAFGTAVRRYEVSGAFRTIGESAVARVMRRWPGTRLMALEFASSIGPRPVTTDDKVARGYEHQLAAAVGLIGTLAAFPLDESTRSQIRQELVRLAGFGASRTALSRAISNLIVSGELGNNWDSHADRALAVQLGVDDGTPSSVSYQLSTAHRYQGWSNTNPVRISQLTRPERGPLSSLPVALWTLSKVSTAQGAFAQQLAERVSKLVFVDQVGPEAAQWALDVLGDRLGTTFELSERAKLPRRLRYRKVPTEPAFDRSQVLDVSVEDLLEALRLDHSGRIASSLGHAVSSRLGDDLEAWQIFLGIVDETCTTMRDAVEFANTLVGKPTAA